MSLLLSASYNSYVFCTILLDYLKMPAILSTLCFFLIFISILTSNAFRMQRKSISATTAKIEMVAQVCDLPNLSVKEALRACAGSSSDITSSNGRVSPCDIVKAAPNICKFIIANPKALFENKDIAKFHGFDADAFNSSTSLTELAKHLPVIYIAGKIEHVNNSSYG